MSVMIARRIARPLPPPSPEAHREIAKSQVAEADAEKSLRTRWRIARICSEIQPRKGIRDLCAAVRCALDFSTIIRCRNIIYDIKKKIYIYIYTRACIRVFYKMRIKSVSNCCFAKKRCTSATLSFRPPARNPLEIEQQKSRRRSSNVSRIVNSRSSRGTELE